MPDAQVAARIGRTKKAVYLQRRKLGIAKYPALAVLDRETQEMVEQAIAGLPPKYRAVYVLSEVEHFSNAEIADLLGLSLPGVKSRLHRARRMMRQALAAYL
jgi:RNA polymerase sigma-70 factor (ECF subfamily)